MKTVDYLIIRDNVATETNFESFKMSKPCHVAVFSFCLCLYWCKQ